MEHLRHTWPLQTALCPCDVHFADFLDRHRIADSTIFHLGTGEHHHVGRCVARQGRSNAVLGMTYSLRELEAYAVLTAADPALARSYQVLLGDLYLLDPRFLPDLDIATLFHLGEYRRPEIANQARSDTEILESVIGRLRPNGRILFYAGSDAYAAAQGAIKALERRGLIVPAGTHESLVIYRKPA